MNAGPATPRRIAQDLLLLVLEEGRPLDRALAESAPLTALAPRDRAFARALLASALRHLGVIDALIARCLERAPKGAAGARANAALRLGAAQIFFMDVPDHAAVAESVGLAPERFKALVNAVLRRLIREGATLRAELDESVARLPAWLWQSWRLAYGEERARAMIAAQAGDPPLDLYAKEDAEGWARRLGAEQPIPDVLRLSAGMGDVALLDGYKEGAWWVQDLAASLPARLLPDRPGGPVADLCAAPGGKTAQLAAAGHEVLAVDIDAQRLSRVKQNLERLSLAAALIEADATAWRPPQPVPAVLLDAPCSATGTIRRHPDIPWHRRPSDLAGLADLQDRLLENAVAMLAPGGTLVYAVCSLQPEEGVERIAALLESHAELTRAPVEASEVAGLSQCLTEAGDLRTLPCHLAEAGGMDGFYACRLVKA